MILKIFRSATSLLDFDLKKKIKSLQLIYLLVTLAEFLNVTLFYTFLNSLFQVENQNYLTNFFGKNFNIYIDSIYGSLILIIVFFISNFSTVYLNYKIFYLSEIISASLSSNFFKKILTTKFKIYSKFHPSEIIKKINVEIPLLSAGVFQPILMLFSKIVVLIIFITFILLNFDYRASLLIIFVFLIYLSIFFIFKKILFNYGKKISLYLGLMNKSLYESLNNFLLIKLLNKELFFIKKFKNYLNAQAKFKSYGYLIGQFPKSLIEFLVFATLIFLSFIIYNQDAEALYDLLPLIAIIAFIGYRVLPIGQQIYSSITLIKNSSYVLGKIKKNFKLFETEKFEPSIKQINKINTLQLKKINFYYDEPKNLIIENFSFNFKKGKMYLIKGSSGKGKTTLINLIMGFLEPKSGSIFVNKTKKINIKNMDIIRNKTFFSPQFSYLFNANLYQNISLDFSSNKIINNKLYINALKNANIFRDLKSYVKNFNKKIGHLGSTLSGGQIQRISIARVYYNKRDIIIFDEPTNNLDQKNKSILLKNIRNLKKNSIVIVLSHDDDVEKYSDHKILLN